MTIDYSNYKSTFKTVTIVAMIGLFLVVIVASTVYTATGKNKIQNNQQSQNKMTMLNESLNSFLGPKWPYILLVMVVMVAIILLFVYFSVQNRSVNITLNDKSAHVVTISAIVIAVIFTVIMVLLAIKEYRNTKNTEQTGNIPNYDPNIDNKKKTQQLLTIVGLTLFIVLGGGFSFWYLRHRQTS